MRSQALALAARPHVVVATPGRLADHVRSGGGGDDDDVAAALRRARFAVLDEADRLLAAGSGTGSMLPDVEACLSALPPPGARQTLLFTATLTPEVNALRAVPPRPGREPVFVCDVVSDGTKDAAAAAAAAAATSASGAVADADTDAPPPPSPLPPPGASVLPATLD